MTSILLLAGLAVAHAQFPAFDAVPVKLSPPDAGSTVSSRGGPGTRTPGVWTCQNMSLNNIVWIAFNLRSQQLAAPDWMNEPRFDITAKIPEGATAVCIPGAVPWFPPKRGRAEIESAPIRRPLHDTASRKFGDENVDLAAARRLQQLLPQLQGNHLLLRV